MGIVAAAQIASVYYDARADAQHVAESIAEAGLLARRGFDAVGHFGRGDIFSLSLHGVSIPLEINAPVSMTGMSDQIWGVCADKESEQV